MFGRRVYLSPFADLDGGDAKKRICPDSVGVSLFLRLSLPARITIARRTSVIEIELNRN